MDTNDSPPLTLTAAFLICRSPAHTRRSRLDTKLSWLAMASTDQERFTLCFQEWITRQESDLDELLETLRPGEGSREGILKDLAEKSMRHYVEYSEKRRSLAREDAPTFFCPSWCTTLENSLLWMGGCRPSMAIRLLYALCGSFLESHVHDFLSGSRHSGSDANVEDTMGLFAGQLGCVNDLHVRTLRQEDKLSTRMAALQEDIADMPLLPIIKDRQNRRKMRIREGEATIAGSNGGNKDGGNANGEVKAAMESYAVSLANILEEADELRIRTLRELVEKILTPVQAAELLVAAKQLHLSLHELGRCRDPQHGRT